MKFIIYLSFLLILYITYGFYLSQFEVDFVPKKIKSQNSTILFDYKGIINVHTTNSIGSKPHAFIIESAKEANSDFIVFSDLNQFHKAQNIEGYYGKFLSMVGNKFSYLDSRIITLSSNAQELGSSLGEVQLKLTDLLSQQPGANRDTLTVLAHPFKSGFAWVGEYPTGLDGIEILNLKSLALRSWEESKLSTLWSVFVYPFNPRLAFARLFMEPSEELTLLDKISSERFFLGFAGSEASARAIPLSNYLMKFPSYQKTFETVSNHVLTRSELTGNLKTDRSKIFKALKNGNFYNCLDIFGDPKGFLAYAEADGKILLLGSQIKSSPSLTLHIVLPGIPSVPYEIVVYKNGDRYITVNEPELHQHLSESGAYRIQVRLIPTLPLPDAKKWVTWIYTNPIWVSKQ